ncbi:MULTISPECIES: ribonuclease HII [unclassified Corynebacterium]|uniref:ribonuclease HII n=1 Tax=unclassified Corynebacterium TaxID=2624378 RepID=UPI0008A51CCF|nr:MULTISPECIES: ribonuclease HII [unclassified Corynebacterium]MDK6301261.1 ribonuclease HII [Corynebacterium sp. UMB9976]OFS16371.1 ribonuclease HII [Corynebacterium sp. HMSC27B11]
MARPTPQSAARARGAELVQQALSEGYSFVDDYLRFHGFTHVAGVDEAGRGACCGPITIASCVLPDHDVPELEGLNDSKKLTPRRREKLFGAITEHAVAYKIVHIPAAEIDQKGIQYANINGMYRAVAGLSVEPDVVLTDAVHLPELACEHAPLVKGDALSPAISAASILAKVSRDRLMVEMDGQYPDYGLAGHKGYGTAKHMAAVRLHGGCPEHRYTYSNVATAHAEWASTQPREEGHPGQ